MYKVKTVIILGILALVCQAQAQEVKEKKMAFDGARSVYLHLSLGNSITVKGWNKNEVYVKTSVEINGGKLNKALSMSYEKLGDEIVIKSKLDYDLLKKGKKEDCSDNYHNYSSSVNGERFYTCYKITHEIMMPRNAALRVKTINNKINLESLTGNLKINTVNGSINMTAQSIQPSQALKFNTVNGKIDLTVPASANTQVKMSTVNGRIYSHFEVPQKTKNGMRRIGGNRYNQRVKLTLGDGAASTVLSTVNGRIYLRKGK
ncbi:DUF4097 family beta strand repeat-containing protein [Microscilla marina]|uniref:DUF4097 domain-containing protein n=1 Tax=Microscilla marina ATCC 23134 TaxID=313606 RepID=A1ZXB5_MICM2|nr:DUF4097 family beta strand repeat-containing protein [Microscilla marina]EAY24989.1 conserved hypothetical protein [Microscilla marina ATCC 23134]